MNETSPSLPAACPSPGAAVGVSSFGPPHRPHTPLSGDDMLTTSEAARLIGVSAETIRAWLRDGRLPCIDTRLGALIARRDVEMVIARRAAEQTDAAVRRRSRRAFGARA